MVVVAAMDVVDVDSTAAAAATARRRGDNDEFGVVAVVRVSGWKDENDGRVGVDAGEDDNGTYSSTWSSWL